MKKEQFGSLDPRAAAHAHASSLISTLWAFRALYTVRNEFWITQPCSVCAFRVVFELSSGPIQVETFIKACQILHEMSGRFPLATDVLASIQSVIEQHKLQLPSFTTKHLNFQRSATTTTIMQQTITSVSPDYVDAGCESESQGSKRMTVSDLILTSNPHINPD